MWKNQRMCAFTKKNATLLRHSDWSYFVSIFSYLISRRNHRLHNHLQMHHRNLLPRRHNRRHAK